MIPITLEQFFKDNPVVGLGFSGGVDSSYLLYAAVKYGAKVNAYFAKTPFQPEFELRDAHRIADQVGVDITVLNLDVLDNGNITANPNDRCYYCKTAIFNALKERAAADGIDFIIDGTNASDDVSDRPGMKALTELSVRSPLRECGITKDRVRQLSKEAGLFTWNKPAYACLATRVPAGRAITSDLLNRIEKAEDGIFKLGYSDFRVRLYGEGARLQFPKAQMSSVLNGREEVIAALKPYFSDILLDLEGR